MHLHGVQDISTILTPILTHEYSLEKEFNNICNEESFNMFQWSDQD